MMQMEASRLTDIEALKNMLFDEIVLQVAHQNEVPMMAAGWNSVLEEVEMEVEIMLIRPTPMSSHPSPEFEAMITMWRRLENESRKLRTANDWQMVMPMAV